MQDLSKRHGFAQVESTLLQQILQGEGEVPPGRDAAQTPRCDASIPPDPDGQNGRAVRPASEAEAETVPVAKSHGGGIGGGDAGQAVGKSPGEETGPTGAPWRADW